MEMVAELVLTALAAALLSFLVAKLVSAAVGGGEAVVEERRLVGGGRRRSGKSVRFAGVEESRNMVVDRFEAVEDEDDDRDMVDGSFGATAAVGGGVEDEGFVRSESVGDCAEEIGEVAAVCGDGRQFEEMLAEGDEVERRGEVDGLMQGSPAKTLEMLRGVSVEGRDEMLVGESRVEYEGVSDVSGHWGEQVEGAEGNEKKAEKEEVAGEGLDETGDESVHDIARSCDSVEGIRSLKLEDTDGVGEVTESGNGSVSVDETGDGFGAENVVSGHANEVTFCTQAEHIDETEEEEESMELQAMHVENSDVGKEGKNEELKDALADRIEKYLRNMESGVKEEENKDLQLEEDEKEKEKTEIDAKVEPRPGSSGEEEDDWEGVEMSELDNDFTAAAAFVRKEDKDGKLSSIGSEARMQLYGLQKIIMEGPCREPQPMALKMSARTKWNAWQRLGNMNPEEAMKQYIALVADIVPNWTEQNTGVDDRSDGLDAKKLCVSDQDQPKPPNERVIYDTEGGGTSGSSRIESKDNK